MPNGYDYLMADIPMTHNVLDYCEILLAAQKKLTETRHFNSVKDELRLPILRQLQLIEHILKFIEQIFFQKTKPGIIEHNKDMTCASKELFEGLLKSGVQEIEAQQRRDKVANNKLDYEAIESKLSTLKNGLSTLRQTLESQK